MERKSKVKVDVYDSEITLIVTDDVYKSYVRVCKKEGWSHEDTTESNVGAGYFLWDDENIGYYYLILPKSIDLSLHPHEVLHCTFIILHHHDVIYDPHNHEAFTYLMGYVMQSVGTKLKKMR